MTLPKRSTSSAVAVRPSRCRRTSGQLERYQAGGVERRAGRLERQAVGQPRRDRREDVAAVKGGRERREPELVVGELDGLGHAAVARDGQHHEAVVRAHEEAVAGAAQGDRPPRAAHARVDDREVHGALRHVRQRVAQDERAGHDVALRQPVRDVDDAHLRRESRDDAAAHAGEVVGVAVVAGEADEPGHGRQPTTSRRVRAQRRHPLATPAQPVTPRRRSLRYDRRAPASAHGIEGSARTEGEAADGTAAAAGDLAQRLVVQ